MSCLYKVTVVRLLCKYIVYEERVLRDLTNDQSWRNLHLYSIYNQLSFVGNPRYLFL